MDDGVGVLTGFCFTCWLIGALGTDWKGVKGELLFSRVLTRYIFIFSKTLFLFFESVCLNY